jgi:hypothetical protein
MDVLNQVFGGWSVPNSAALVILLAFLALYYLFAARARAGYPYTLRGIAAYDAIERAVGQAAEKGQPLHLALGTGGIAGAEAMQTWAGLKMLEHLAYQAALCDTKLLVSVSDPTALPAAQEIMYRGYTRAGYPDDYSPKQVRFVAPDPVAYASGVMGTLHREDLAANIMVGAFGDEYLLMGEAGARNELLQISGTVDPTTLPFMYASSDRLLVGEEIFAGAAYLRQEPNQVGGLVAQDVIRTAIVLTVVLGVILRSFGIL